MLHVVDAHVMCQSARRSCFALSGGFSQRGIPVVLDRVLGSAWDVLSYLRPFVAQVPVASNQQLLLSLRPGISPDVWPQLVIPALTALLADPSWKGCSNQAPTAFPVFLHQPGCQRNKLKLAETVLAIRSLCGSIRTELAGSKPIPNEHLIVAAVPVAFDLCNGMSLSFGLLGHDPRLLHAGGQ